MASQAANVPREHELLCEFCGYGLDGLPPSALCPECGKPVADSIMAPQRVPAAWEATRNSRFKAFWQTTVYVVSAPIKFYRHTESRRDLSSTSSFALIHYWLSAYLYAAAAVLHLIALSSLSFRPRSFDATVIVILWAGVLSPALFLLLLGIRLLAGRLSALESRYHGLRLPLPVVKRALHFHAAQLLPVSLITAVITGVYCIGRQAYFEPSIPFFFSPASDQTYLYLLSAWVILAAAYLFWTYWMAMKAIMYANR